MILLENITFINKLDSFDIVFFLQKYPLKIIFLPSYRSNFFGLSIKIFFKLKFYKLKSNWSQIIMKKYWVDILYLIL